MAKKSTATGSMSDAIRDYFKAHPKASQQEVAAGLAAEGVKVSTSLINKIKYGKAKGRSKAKGAQGRKAANGVARKSAAHGNSTGENGSAGGSKAQAVRDAFASLGRRTRPRDIIAHLLEQGIKVSAAQVSAVRKSLRKRGPAAGALRTATTARGEIHVSMEHLLAAKKLADQVGIEAARRALDLLARLVN